VKKNIDYVNLHISYLPTYFWDDIEIVELLLPKSISYIKCLTERTKLRKELIRPLILKNPAFVLANLKDIPTYFWDDKDFVSMVISVDGRLMKLASPRLKQNGVLFKSAIKQNHQAIYYIPDEFKKDPAFIYDIIDLNAYFICFAKERKIWFLVSCIKKNPLVFLFLNDSEKTNESLQIEAFKYCSILKTIYTEKTRLSANLSQEFKL
jgi:hypothetical protein